MRVYQYKTIREWLEARRDKAFTKEEIKALELLVKRQAE